MKKKIILVLLIVLAIGSIILGLVLFNKNKDLESKKIKIFDATYPACSSSYEKVFEDDTFNYYLTCSKVDSVFVRFPNGNKMLVAQALDENKVTMDELIKAGLDVYKERR